MTTIIINPSNPSNPPFENGLATAHGYYVRTYTGADCAEINDTYATTLKDATSLHAELLTQWDQEARNNDTESPYYRYGSPVLFSIS